MGGGAVGSERPHSCSRQRRGGRPQQTPPPGLPWSLKMCPPMPGARRKEVGPTRSGRGGGRAAKWGGLLSQRERDGKESTTEPGAPPGAQWPVSPLSGHWRRAGHPAPGDPASSKACSPMEPEGWVSPPSGQTRSPAPPPASTGGGGLSAAVDGLDPTEPSAPGRENRSFPPGAICFGI